MQVRWTREVSMEWKRSNPVFPVADIAALNGIHALFLDEDNLRLQSTGVADYNQLANAVRAAAKSHNKYLCTVDRKATPQVMACNP